MDKNTRKDKINAIRILQQTYCAESVSSIKILNNLSDENYHIKAQYIDARNKCKFLITQNDMIIPVHASGSLYDVQIIKNIDKYIKSYDETLKQINKLYNITNQ